jgi:hypothetical protein
MRPKIIPGTPLEYKELMEQCWNADPEKRPDTKTLRNKIGEMRRLSYQNEEQQQINNNTNINNSQFNIGYSITSNIMSFSSVNNSFFGSFSSRIYKFKNLPQPRNATKGKILNIILY